MNYFDALKKYNSGRQAWCSPRKGTAEYTAVMAIMKGGSGAGGTHAAMDAPKPKRKYVRKAKADLMDDMPAAKPKRKYVRKAKPAAAGGSFNMSLANATKAAMGGMAMPKPKRKYVRKAKPPTMSPAPIGNEMVMYNSPAPIAPKPKRKYVRKTAAAAAPNTYKRKAACYDEFGNLKGKPKRPYVRKVPYKGMGSASLSNALRNYDALNAALPLAPASRTNAGAARTRSGQFI